MKFNYYDLGMLSAGEIVEVTLSAAANVRLMDSSNYHSYKSGRQHKYYGGLVKRSPYRLGIPRSGHWYVTVDLQGLSGSVRSSVRMMPKPLQEAKQLPLASVPTLLHRDLSPSDIQDGVDSRKKYDVFISHATEDKDAIVRSLAHALQDNSLHVWFDEFELKIGDSLRRKIDLGLANSRFGIVVLSKAFFAKGWTNYELDGIVTRSNTGEQILLPIWHGVTKQEVLDYSPSLADKVARNTTSSTVEEIADEITLLIKSG